jgi:hypothetical protein
MVVTELSFDPLAFLEQGRITSGKYAGGYLVAPAGALNWYFANIGLPSEDDEPSQPSCSVSSEDQGRAQGLTQLRSNLSSPTFPPLRIRQPECHRKLRGSEADVDLWC